MLKLVFPDTSHKNEYLSMIQEWRAFEVPTSPGKLFAGENFEEFFDTIQNDLTNNPNGVNATLFFLIDLEDRIL